MSELYGLAGDGGGPMGVTSFLGLLRAAKVFSPFLVLIVISFGSTPLRSGFLRGARFLGSRSNSGGEGGESDPASSIFYKRTLLHWYGWDNSEKLMCAPLRLTT